VYFYRDYFYGVLVVKKGQNAGRSYRSASIRHYPISWTAQVSRFYNPLKQENAVERMLPEVFRMEVMLSWLKISGRTVT
jgi:hypothetical protein